MQHRPYQIKICSIDKLSPTYARVELHLATIIDKFAVIHLLAFLIKLAVEHSARFQRVAHISLGSGLKPVVAHIAVKVHLHHIRVLLVVTLGKVAEYESAASVLPGESKSIEGKDSISPFTLDMYGLVRYAGNGDTYLIADYRSIAERI